MKLNDMLREKLRVHLGEPLEGGKYQEVITRAYACLSLQDDVAWEALMRTMAPFYGMEYTEAQHTELSWRLAAGRDWLEAGIHIEPKFVSAQPYWAPVLMEDCQYMPKFRDREDRVRARMRLLAGRFSGHAFTQAWSHKYHTRFLAKEIGFPIYEPVNYRELTNMWFAGLLDTRNPKRPSIVEVFGPSGAVSHNRQLRKSRGHCPYGHVWECWKCHLGYSGAGGCIKATHMHTFVRRSCPRCHNTEAWFDPASSFNFCVTCLARDRRRAMMGG
jgi:hypothetical protein